MPPKRPLEDPPPVTSSSDDEQLSSEENDAVEDDEETDVVQEDDGKSDHEVEEEEEDENDHDGEEEKEEEEDDDDDDEKSSVKKQNVSPQPHTPSDSEDDSVSEPESDKTLPSPNVSDFTIKPILSKPMDVSAKSKKAAPKPNSTPASAAPLGKRGSKRAAESESIGNELKKKKVASGGDDEEGKKGSGFQRLWSEDDEIAILKGMSEYQSKKGTDPYSDMGGFYEFIKKSLHVDVSKNQLIDKIRRLKKKYKTNVEKGEKGEDPVFSRPHDLKSFELSKKIWGIEVNDAAVESGKSKRTTNQSGNKINIPIPVTLALPRQDVGVKKQELNGEVKTHGDEFWANYPYLSESLETEKFLAPPEFLKSLLRTKMGLIGSEKLEKMEEKWRKLQGKALELYVKRIELVWEQSKLALDAMKSSMS